MDIPYPSQHTMSGNNRPAGEMPFECFRCCIAKKEERKAAGGGGDRLECPVETHSICVVFFFMCCCFFTVHRGGGGVIVHIVCFIEWNPKGRCNRLVFQWARRVVWLNGFDQGISVN